LLCESQLRRESHNEQAIIGIVHRRQHHRHTMFVVSSINTHHHHHHRHCRPSSISIITHSSLIPQRSPRDHRDHHPRLIIISVIIIFIGTASW
jgi:hypothetical protein